MASQYASPPPPLPQRRQSAPVSSGPPRVPTGVPSLAGAIALGENYGRMAFESPSNASTMQPSAPFLGDTESQGNTYPWRPAIPTAVAVPHNPPPHAPPPPLPPSYAELYNLPSGGIIPPCLQPTPLPPPPLARVQPSSSASSVSSVASAHGRLSGGAAYMGNGRAGGERSGEPAIERPMSAQPLRGSRSQHQLIGHAPAPITAQAQRIGPAGTSYPSFAIPDVPPAAAAPVRASARASGTTGSSRSNSRASSPDSLATSGKGSSVVNRWNTTLFGGRSYDSQPGAGSNDGHEFRKLKYDVLPSANSGGAQLFDAIITMRPRAEPGAHPITQKIGVYPSQREAREACLAYAPPVKAQEGDGAALACVICSCTFGLLMKRRHHCRNCGNWTCGNCSENYWPPSMLPHTYTVDKAEKKCRICDKCHRSMEAFRAALLAGDEGAAMDTYRTGCVNLRQPYTIYMSELPVHCAAEGGNLDLLRWLMEEKYCPIFKDATKTLALGTAKRESVLGVAASKGHVTILRYLLIVQGAQVTECTNMNALWLCLDKVLKEGSGVQTPSPHSLAMAVSVAPSAPFMDETGDDVLNECIVCFDVPRDCILVPCGHLACCQPCATQLLKCPICRTPITQAVKAINV